MKHLLIIMLLLPVAGCGKGEGRGAEDDSPSSAVQVEPRPEPSTPNFAPAEEAVDGWFHRHEFDSWVAKGADEAVARFVLARIAAADGLRANPDWIDSIPVYGPGNWVYEWVQAGEAALAQASAAPASAGASLEAALAYFTIASWPHLGNEADTAALVKAREVYLALGARLPVPVTHERFAVADGFSRGYLHLPAGEGPFPVVLFTYGSDVTKEDGLRFFRDELLPRGIALFSVDMPGIGEGSALNLLGGSDQVLAGAKDFLQAHPAIDLRHLYIAGASFGGNAAARAFLTMDGLAGVISMCGPLHTPFMAPPEMIEALPPLTIEGVKARVGLKGQSAEALAEVLPQVSLKVQGLFEGPAIHTPLLVFTTNRDPVAPLGDLPGLLGRAADAETLIIDEEGHCPPRPVRQAVVARWVSDLVREG